MRTVLKVYTAPMAYYGDDGLDVTASANSPFAPSWRLLRPYLSKGLSNCTDEDWSEYAAGYIAEMRQSYRSHRDVWNALLQRDRVVLLCLCPARRWNRCHRRLLAGILVKLGAVDEGELRLRPV